MPSRGMNMVSCGSGEQNNASRGRGSDAGGTGEAPGHLPLPPEGTLIYTVFAKKCQKQCRKGVPPVFGRQIDGVTYLGYVSARRAL